MNIKSNEVQEVGGRGRKKEANLTYLNIKRDTIHIRIIYYEKTSEENKITNKYLRKAAATSLQR